MDEIIKNIEKRFLENNLNCLHFKKGEPEANEIHSYFLNNNLLKNTEFSYTMNGSFKKFKFLFETIDINDNNKKFDVYITKINEKDQLTPSEPERQIMREIKKIVKENTPKRLEEIAETQNAKNAEITTTNPLYGLREALAVYFKEEAEKKQKNLIKQKQKEITL